MSMLPAWCVSQLVREYVHGQTTGTQPKALAIGNFDGIHRGHAHLIEQVCAHARANNLEAAVLTFEPTPVAFFKGDAPRLQSLADKALHLQDAHPGLDALIAAQFDQAFANLSPEDFVRDVLCAGLSVKHVIVGSDFRFGKDRAGDTNTLAKLAEECGYAFAVAETQSDATERISSSRIRDALAGGDIALAETLLGHPYTITAEVVTGDKLGHQLGYPTANLDFPHTPALRGIFAARASFGNEIDWPAAVSIGTRPAVGGERLQIEAHLLDFDGDLYGQPLTLRFVERLREESDFEDTAALVAQIAADVKQVQVILASKRDS